jgi:glycosyltransferase involved in cell wall biosynthesis
MALGKAIVAPDQPNIREILTDEKSALLFKPEEPALLGDTVVLLATDPVLRARLGETARALIDSEGYSWKKNAERVVGILGSCAESTQRPA